MVESFRGSAIAVQVRPGFPLMGTADRRFRSALADPGRERVRYVVATDPSRLPDAISGPPGQQGTAATSAVAGPGRRGQGRLMIV